MSLSARVKMMLVLSGLLSLHSAGHAFDAMSVEAGAGNQTRLLRFGVQTASPHEFLIGTSTRIVLAWELSLAYWRARPSSNDTSDQSSLWDLGLTPTFRMLGANEYGLYGEAGLGLHGLSRRYNHNGRDLSTNLQFGSHLGIGYEFRNGMDLSLKIQHLSNGGIKQPNAGINFVAIRLARRF